MARFDARRFLRTVPEAPGVYRMIGEADAVLYVGKAKNLKRRVSSYFQRGASSPRIALMVSQVTRVELTVTRSEAEALLLENHLIKSLTPKYNILFRDDKSYPYIRLSAHAFPRLAFHRGAFAKGDSYFGPFPSAWAVRESLQLLQKVFRLRTCEDSVFQNRSRPCLLHQIQRCKAPCVGLVADDEYAADVRLTGLFLNGRTSAVIEALGERMEAAAEALAFEQAAAYRDQIRALQKVLHKQYVDSRKDEDVDVLVAVEAGGSVCINLAMVRGGRHLGDRPQFPANAGGASVDEVLLPFAEQHYDGHSAPARIVVEGGAEALALLLGELLEQPPTVAVARFEAERGWLEMARNNARLAVTARIADAGRSEQRLEALKQALDLGEVPQRIECFDISHTMGEATVASCVVCEQGRMKRAEYRRYNIAGITGGDDYAAMRQALGRRFERVAMGDGVCPDLLLIDGGKGQLGVATEVLAELGLEALPVIGVAKGEGRKPGLETLVFADGRLAAHLSADDPALHLVQEIRDEAHRFAITGHRARRAKARVGSRLEDIPGIGPSRRRDLLAAFGGLDGVRSATIEDLCRVEGINRKLAQQIYNALH